jgi:hypothetical protein
MRQRPPYPLHNTRHRPPIRNAKLPCNREILTAPPDIHS